MGEREAGERKFPILFVDWTSGDFEGGKKKREKNRIVVLDPVCRLIRGSRHTPILAFFRSKKRIHATAHFHSHFRATNHSADTIVSRQVQEISKSGSLTSDLPV